MSLIIAKVDKTNKLQSIYSDGIAVASQEIVSNNTNKVGHFMSGDFCVSFGNTGPAYLNQYIRTHFKEVFSETIKNKPVNGSQTAYFILSLPVMFNHMRREFIKEFNVSETDDEFTGNKGSIVIINGEIYIVPQPEGENYRATHKYGYEHWAYGVGEEAANCLLDTNIPINEIFGIISRHYTSVNNTVFAEENFIYFK